MNTFQNIDQVIQSNLSKLQKPGALIVRPGYKIRGGWITKDPAIVVTVSQKRANVSPADAIPSTVGPYPTDVREATTIEKLRFSDPQRYANVVASARPEFAQPEFPLERDIKTGQLLQKPAPTDAVASQVAKPTVP
ncbi:MAG TPA: hypothetical protein VEU52_00480, partial [Candidatus Limnocylindrales bacterium]|nr:hypothetical protein [Candidatus Limnocylindrales bacterium]